MVPRQAMITTAGFIDIGQLFGMLVPVQAALQPSDAVHGVSLAD